MRKVTKGVSKTRLLFMQSRFFELSHFQHTPYLTVSYTKIVGYRRSATIPFHVGEILSRGERYCVGLNL
jgi:hypothetical protein